MTAATFELLALVALVGDGRRARRRQRRRLRVVHASGKWNGLARVWAAYLKAASFRADLITTTESRGKLDAIRHALGPKWEACILGEFVVAVRKSRAQLGAGRLAVVSDQFSGSSEWRDTRVHYRWIRVRGFGPVLVAVSHLSSAIQDGAGFSGFDAGVDSWQQATRAIGRVVDRRLELVPDAVVIFCGDVNAHQGLKPWRRRLRQALNMRGMWDKSRPDRGTHGPVRIIDGIWTTARILKRAIGPSAGGRFDHRRVRAVIELPEPVDRGQLELVA